jgi:hypothetical protein
MKLWIAAVIILAFGVLFASDSIPGFSGNDSREREACVESVEITQPARGTLLEFQNNTTVTRRIC